MRERLLHTPEGVRDIYNEECEKKLVLEEKLNGMLRQYGYRPIQTPTFEYFDIFGKEIGTTPSRDLYKFFDREGNTLALRPDITPSVARCAATYFHEEEMPVRLCYAGNTFINNNSYQGRLKENTQLGAELIGDLGVDADAEMISMVVDCLRAAGLKEFQISVGHADFFRGLKEAAGLKEEQEEELRGLIANKNFFGVDEMISSMNLKEELKQLFGMLGNFYTGPEDFGAARRCAAGYPRISEALGRLEELHAILEVYGISRYVSFELGIISRYQYYTGIIFAGYTFGSGEAIVQGGRYDRLLTHFGKASASIGFAIVLDQLMAVLLRQKIEVPVNRLLLLIVYGPSGRSEAILQARKRRSAGQAVVLLARDPAKTEADYTAYAQQNHITEIRFL